MPYLGARPADITSATEAEIAGDLTVDTNTLKVDATNNRVGVGTTAGDAGASLTINKSPVAAHGNPLLQVGGSTFTSGGYYTIGLGYTNSTYTEPPAEISYISQSDSGGTKGAIVFGTRDVTTNTAVTERLRILSGGGLTFNGDTAAANALDDYEEGTWTPGISTGTVGTSYAYYTKVGNLVTLNVNLHTFSDRTSTDVINISGLPYTTSSNNRAVGAVMHRYIDDSGEDVTSWVESNVSAIKFYLNSQSSNWAQLKHNDLMSASAQIYMTITYQAA